MYKDNRSHHEAEVMGFPSSNYLFPADGNTFTGTLIFKKWSRTKALVCYFDTDTGEKKKLCVWFSSDETRTYRPKRSDINFKEVKLNTKWGVTYLIIRSGKTMWLTANQII